ncbi:MAG: type II toxin-antitoxin system RelE/ParE family toxin [Thermoplasmata archaeon]
MGCEAVVYAVSFTKTAEEQLRKLDKAIQARITGTLERIRIRPQHFCKRLTGCPYYRIRAGDWRIIVDIRENEMVILVLEVGHRKNIYDR